MNDVEELKQYIGVHAEGQDLPGYQDLLARIDHDGEGPGSWCGEWSARAGLLLARGDRLGAARHYIMARFPFPDGPARQEAQRRAVDAFSGWAADHGIERVEVDLDGHRAACWQPVARPRRPGPLVVVTGGFLTLKEQWAPALGAFARLGLTPVVTEMPGVGDNELPYDGKSRRFLPLLLDALGQRHDVSRTYALAMSFSGHLALGGALQDHRIRGVVTVGAPVREFFLDPEQHRRLPRVTVDTLAHLTGRPVGEMGEWALTPDELRALEVPLAYVHSRRDEVIPAAELDGLTRHVRHLDVLEHDDVHGSPGHVTETKMWTALSILRMAGVRDHRRVMTALAWRAARLLAR